jgi:hypothetical protein
LATPRRYLGDTSATPRPHLGHTSATPRPHLGGGSAVSAGAALRPGRPALRRDGVRQDARGASPCGGRTHGPSMVSQARQDPRGPRAHRGHPPDFADLAARRRLLLLLLVPPAAVAAVAAAAPSPAPAAQGQGGWREGKGKGGGRRRWRQRRRRQDPLPRDSDRGASLALVWRRLSACGRRLFTPLAVDRCLRRWCASGSPRSERAWSAAAPEEGEEEEEEGLGCAWRRTRRSRSSEITRDRPRSPEIARDRPRSPEIARDRPRSPEITAEQVVPRDAAGKWRGSAAALAAHDVVVTAHAQWFAF